MLLVGVVLEVVLVGHSDLYYKTDSFGTIMAERVKIIIFILSFMINSRIERRCVSFVDALILCQRCFRFFPTMKRG